MDAPSYYHEYEYNYENITFDGIFNFSRPCSSSTLHGSNIFLPIMYYLIFFTGFFGNLFVILVVSSKGRGGRLVDTFVVNLALADLVFVLTLPLWAISATQNGYWNFGQIGDLLCKLSSYIIAVNRFSNIFFLTCMSVDRYLAVVKLMDSRYLRSSRCIRATCAAVWLCSLVLGIPSLVYRAVEESSDGGLSCVEDNNSTFVHGLNLAMALLTFIFPVLIIVTCYGTIVVHLNKHCAAAANPRAEARRRHSVKMVLSIIVAFVVSWLPFNIFKVIIIVSQLLNVDLSCDAQSWQKNGLLISCCLAFLNSCVNPAIYFFLDHHFRRRVKILYETCTGKPKFLHSYNSSASFTNMGTSESFTTGDTLQPLYYTFQFIRRATGSRSTDMEGNGEISDTDSGIILHSGSDSPTTHTKDVTTHTRAMKLKHQDLQDRLENCIRELKKLCIREAELTGRLPDDYPLLPGEKPPQIRRRVGAAFKLDEQSIPQGAEESELSLADAELAIQMKIYEAARKLCEEEHLSKAVRKSRLQHRKRAEKKLKQLQETAFQLRLEHGRSSPLPAFNLAQQDLGTSDDSSLSDSVVLDEEVASQSSQLSSGLLCPGDTDPPQPPPVSSQSFVDGSYTSPSVAPQPPLLSPSQSPHPSLESTPSLSSSPACDLPPIQHSPWTESSLDQPYEKSKKSRSSSKTSSPAKSELLPPLEACLAQSGLPLQLSHLKLSRTQSNSMPSTPEMRVHRQLSLRLSNPESPFEKERGRTRGPRRRLTEYSITLPETPPPMLNYGNLASSDDSNSEHSFTSCNSSPYQELPCNSPKQYQTAFPHSGPVGSYGPQAFPRTGFYHNPRQQSSPSFHRAYYNEEMVYPPDMDLAQSYYAQQAPCPSNRYQYWYKDTAAPHQRAQRPFPPDIRHSPSPAQWDHPHYHSSGLPQQVVNEQLKSWHWRSQLKAPRSCSLDRQGAVRVKNMSVRESPCYQNQKYHEQVIHRRTLQRAADDSQGHWVVEDGSHFIFANNVVPLATDIVWISGWGNAMLADEEEEDDEVGEVLTLPLQAHHAMEKMEEFVHKVWEGRWRVIPFHVLPEWLKDNDYLLHGHRPPMPSFRACFGSIFRIHTETGNIWTHLLGLILFLCLGTLTMLRPNMYFMAPLQEKVVFGMFFLGAVLCLSFSWLFHTVYCHSEKVSRTFSKLDYSGIALLIMGSFVPWLYYSFYCSPQPRLIYLTIVCVLGIAAIIVAQWDRFSTPRHRPTRAGVFMGLGLSGIVPTMHFTIEEGFVKATTVGQMGWFYLMGAMYITGAGLYAARIPERYFPGKCDIWFHSHQIFHVLVVAAAFIHFYGVSNLQEFRYGLEGGCTDDTLL
ncbi:hypothetical protein L3Q82_007674 [Scortum barcoo]|uniref:Uncharacterized protein n=1 Tax=Scortum barcoo TaxID=214431 RepID=A0ACB8WP68_9TELE|nr:hypothetical protein L3Q82_007674 [Scortum barcoo]